MPGTEMSKPKHDVANALPEVELDSAGFAHGLHLLLLAIARTNPAVGALLDEFTSMHAEYLAELQQLARGCGVTCRCWSNSPARRG
jgi:hypothetical protein